MTAEVLKLVPPLIFEDYTIETDQVLDHAKEKLSKVVIIGIDEDEELYLAGSHDEQECLWLLNRAIHKLMGMGKVGRT